jgi:tetratricopeptide (TPR) repeat protein
MRREGYEVQELVSFIKRTVSKSNKEAMELLKENKRKSALKLLNETGGLLIEFECKELAELQSLTYNNIACVYKDGNDFQSALKALTKAIDVCLQYDHKENLAVTYLNISTIMGKLNKHKTAFDNAIKAAFQCQEDLLELKLNSDSSKIPTKVVHLAMAYHYMGIHEENLGNTKTATEWYRKACATMESDSGTDPEIRIKFYNKLRAAMNKKGISLTETMSVSTTSPLKKKRKVKVDIGRPSILSKSNKLSKVERKSPINEKTKSVKLTYSTNIRKESIDKATKDMLMAELKYNLREDYGKAQVSPKINSLMVVNKYYPKGLREENKEEVEDLKRLGFGDWTDPKFTGRSIAIFNTSYVNTNGIQDTAVIKIQSFYRKKKAMKFLNMAKDKGQYEVVYGEIYKKEANDNLVLVVLRGSKKDNTADLRLIQLNPCREIFALKEEIDNKATLELNAMKEVWKAVKIKSKGNITKDAKKYFKKLRKYNKDDELLVHGLNNMLQDKELEEIGEKFMVEEVQAEEAAPIIPSKREIKENTINQPEDSVQNDSKEEALIIKTEQYEDEDHIEAKKEESYVSDEEGAADYRAEEFDNGIQKEVERILGGKDAKNEVEANISEEYNEISESIHEEMK